MMNSLGSGKIHLLLANYHEGEIELRFNLKHLKHLKNVYRNRDFQNPDF